MFVGHVDKARVDLLAGWVADTENLEKAIEISVLVNGARRVRCRADVYRADVHESIGSGHHGFAFTLEPYLEVGENSVQVIVEDCGFQPAKSSFKIVNEGSQKYVEEGVDGWLFLQNDSNKVNDVVQGNRPLTQDDVTSLIRVSMLRHLASSAQGAKFLQIIVPEKNVVANQKKKNPLQISEQRPAVQLLSALGASGAAHTLYPLSLFNGHSDPLALYHKTDTHPSPLGQKVIFDLALDALGVSRAYSFVQEEKEILGDLGRKMSPPVKEVINSIQLNRPEGLCIDKVAPALSSGGHLTGQWFYYKSAHEKNGRIYLFGTSTAYYMRDFFCSVFGEVVFSWNNAVDVDAIASFRPDYVVGLLTERTLDGITSDLTLKLDSELRQLWTGQT